MEVYQRGKRNLISKKGLIGALVLILLFQLIGITDKAQAATTKFVQGAGYSKGLYDAYADQPTALNWDRKSRFAGSTIPTPKWTYKTAGAVTASPVTDKSGNIYIGSQDTYLYAFTSDGKLKWKYRTQDSIRSSAAVGSDGTIYVTSGMTLYAVTSAGKTKWTYTIPPAAGASLSLDSAPAIGADGTIYVGVSGYLKSGSATMAKGRLLAISSAGKLKWQYNTGSIDSTPAIAKDGTVYVTDVFYYSDGDYVSLNGTLYAISSLGKKKWQYDFGTYNSASVTIGAAGALYVGSDDDYFYSFNPSTGLPKWKVKLNGDIQSGAAIDANGTVYVGTGGGGLYAITYTGKIKWQFQAKAGIKSTPIVDSAGYVYFGSNDNYVYSLTSTGSLKWKSSTLSQVESSPLINQKKDIIIGSNDGKIYAYNPTGKTQYSFSGKVLDKATKKPISGATIQIAGQKVTTSSTGQFTVSKIPSGKYVLTVGNRGYHTYVYDFYNISANLTGKILYLEPGGLLKTTPASGVSHTTVQISGSRLPIDEYGEVFLDLNKNRLRDDNEVYTWAQTDINGVLKPVSLVIPELKAGSYELLYTSKAIQQDPDSVKPALFTVKPLAATIKSNMITSQPHVKVKVSGSGYAAGEKGYVYFDKNKNGKFEYDEPSDWIIMDKGSFSDLSITIPSVAPGTYSIRFASDYGSLAVTPLTFTVKATTAKISLDKTSGAALTKVTVNGSSFVPGDSGEIYFDTNNNKKLDYGTDPSTYVSADSTGKFSDTLTVPSAKLGTYNIYFYQSSDPLTIAPVTFTITPIQAKLTLSATSALPHDTITVSGTGFQPNESGKVYYDINNNGKYEYDVEGELIEYLTANGEGAFTLYDFGVPDVKTAGTYKIRYESDLGAINITPATIAISKTPATIKASSTSVARGGSVTITGTKFPKGESGSIFIDLDDDGDVDYWPEEPIAYIDADDAGNFQATLDIPADTPTGTFKIKFKSDSQFGPLYVPIIAVTIK